MEKTTTGHPTDPTSKVFAWRLNDLFKKWGNGNMGVGEENARQFLPVMVASMRCTASEALLPDEDDVPAGTVTVLFPWARHAGAASRGVRRWTAFLVFEEEEEANVPKVSKPDKKQLAVHNRRHHNDNGA